ncbi:MAG: hypothetical protein K9L68_02925, partial [Spirochaetales bacterium]|nr:hypothetical protein [Spirochaetales bacterium]MCF7937530.1 hypothetical protein [Spirochaetales bacterium]
MNFTTKITLSLILFSSLLLLASSYFFYTNSTEKLQHSSISYAQSSIEMASTHFTHILLEKIKSAESIVQSTELIESLKRSNRRFSSLSLPEREEYIDKLNTKWVNSDGDDPFVKHYLNNDTALYLKRQGQGPEYGELFLTNQYGALVASTNKLTTLAHSHKYWWKDSFADGKGSIFIDDRGYDTSVGGYVLGIVVPVYYQENVIGILKCNVNIMSFLRELLRYGETIGEDWNISIIRSGGRIVIGEGVEPLSEKLPDSLLDSFTESTGHTFFRGTESDEESLYVYKPIDATSEHSAFSFGGSYESLDHKMGNRGEYWIILGDIESSSLFEDSRELLVSLYRFFIPFIIVLIFLSFLVSKRLTKNINKLTQGISSLREDNLKFDVRIKSKDEVGKLAEEFHNIISKLNETLVSRDQLITKESELENSLREKDYLMKELNHRVKNNLAMVSSLISLKDSETEVDLSDLTHRIDVIKL